MAINKIGAGTRGVRGGMILPLVARLTRRLRIRHHRRHGDTFQGRPVLYLTTVGAKSGRRRVHPLGYAEDGDDAWLIVASVGGAAHNPGWYHNIAAHPDQVSIEVDGRHHDVVPEQLEGHARSDAWRRIVERRPSYAGYQTKTDRLLPVLRLTTRGSHEQAGEQNRNGS
jgi:deazaflavin-dependent oxidoreductase (nitroreductase family)